MSSAYLGRQSVYIKSFKEMNIDKLCENLNNNIYRNALVKKEILISLAQFCFTTRKYLDKIDDHNNKIKNNPFPDAGFDLFCPMDIDTFSYDTSCKINLGIRCAAYSTDGTPMSYYLYPRSSISKTPFRLANSVGIIDSGYRGNIICMLDKINTTSATIEKHTRYFQICSPGLTPIKVILVDSESELGYTERGSGGFGSTGK